MIYASNQYMQDLEASNLYVSSSLKYKILYGNKRRFIGEGSLRVPEMMNFQTLNNERCARQYTMYCD